MSDIEDRTTFIGHCNRRDWGGVALDPFLDWLDEDGEFLTGDEVSDQTFRRKLSEYETRER